jgi:hypothetical protein
MAKKEIKRKKKYWLRGLIIGFIIGIILGIPSLICWINLTNCGNGATISPDGQRPLCGNPYYCIQTLFTLILLGIIIGLVIGLIYGKFKKNK